MHLLYTVPGYPYRCRVILDGDKRGDARDICRKYVSKKFGVPTFKLCEGVDELIATFGSEDAHPVYCLKRDCIEEYLDPKPDYKDSKYDKKRDGPRIAENMDRIPEEIEKLLEVVLAKNQPTA